MTLEDIIGGIFGGMSAPQVGGLTPGEMVQGTLATGMPVSAPRMNAQPLSAPAGSGAPKAAPMAPAGAPADTSAAARGVPSVSGGVIVPEMTVNPLAAFSRGVSRGGLLAGFTQADEERQALAIASAEKRKAEADAQRKATLTYNALVKKGMDEATALAAISDPEIMKVVLPKLFGTQEIKTTTVNGRLVDTQTGRVIADFSQAESGKLDTPEARARAAAAYGLDPNSDAGRSFILTNKLPREDQQRLTATDKKAILEADEMVQTNNAAITAIKEAEGLNDKAYDGTLAAQRAWLVNNFLPWSSEGAEATVNFDNAVIGQALTQLKSIFGGNPTEGERRILLDLQGASNQPVNVRKEILKRAKVAAEARLTFNEQRAKQLRGGTFYGPEGGAAPPAAPAPVAAPGVPQAGTVMDGYRFKGGDPADRKNWEPAQ